MSSMYVEYQLHNGYVHNWLVAGPQAIPVDRSRFLRSDDRNQDDPAQAGRDDDVNRRILQHYYTAQPGITATPVERGPLDAGLFKIGNYQGSWAYYPCPEDHMVDHSGYFPSCHYLRSWAYVEVVSERPQMVLIVVTTYGPADVWTAGKHVLRGEPLQGGVVTHTRQLQLTSGVTPVLVRFENIGMRHTAHACALRVCGAPVRPDQPPAPAAGVHVRFRTLMPNVERRNAFEKLSAAAYMERDVYEGETPIVLRWPDGPRAQCLAHVRLQTLDNRIFAEAESAGGPGDALRLGYAVQLPAGAFQTTLMPNPNEVYLQHMRIFRHLPFWSMGKQRYRAMPAGGLAERRNEALLAAAYIEGSPFAQIARMAWGAWADVDSKVLLTAIERVDRHEDGSNLVLLGLLGMLYRWGDHTRFPEEVRPPLEACIMGYRYWRDEPGHDNMDFTAQSNRLLFHACELLAGQRYPERIFADGQSGAWHRTHGERLAMAWMATFGVYGSSAWNSSDSIAREVAVLTHLCDLVEDEQVYEIATVTLDKLLFALALNSFHGILGAAGQSVGADFVKSGLLQPTAPICYLLWGMGILNHHVAGVVSLACSTNYQMPMIIDTIAREPLGDPAAADLWGREQHAVPHEHAANLVTYKTPDTMLSSVGDYRPGQPGRQEQVWRATLGAEAVVFATHPGSSSESASRYPGYWSGNARLPRVAQWKDALIAIHQLPPDDLLGFTHAYFPTAVFDEYRLHAGWAFARRGHGYLALTNSQGVTLSTQGRYAQRELRAPGPSQSWLVQMGRAARDGDFAEFQAKVLALSVSFADGAVGYTTLRGDTLHFGWEGPFLVNDEAQPRAHSKHYENPYTTTDLPCHQMEIQWGEHGLRLDFTVPTQTG